jgi:hypothetical protein
MNTIIKWIIGIGVILILISTTLRFCGDAADTAYKELSPSALLKKHEWFKDQSSAIDKKRADIQLYENEIKTFKVEDKEDKVYLNQRRTEMLGLISVYNSLCSEYNAQMAKANYQFTNVGDLPQSNLEPLPREYKPYITEVTN